MKLLPRFRAGSALWLLVHETRIFFYNLSLSGKKAAARRGITKVQIGIWLLALAALHAFAWMLLSKFGDKVQHLPVQAVRVVTGVIGVVFTLMLSTALKASVEALFERGDLDLLLSSPLSSFSIFTVRLASVVIGVSSLFLLVLAPFGNVGLVLGQWHWMSVYPVVLSMAMVAASLAMLLTLGLVRWIGVRKTRVTAQLIGALAGAIVFLGSQMFSHVSEETRQRITAISAPWFQPGALLGPDSQVWTPGYALLGAPGPALGMAVAGILAFFLTARLTHRFFVGGLQASGGTRPKRASGPVVVRFRPGLARSVIVKEWRMIARDPNLISQVVMQLLYMVPMLLLLFAKQSAALTSIGAGLTFLCGSLTSSLAWIIISAEDAPEMLRAAPCGMAPIQRAKLVAAMAPPLMLVALPLLWASLDAPIAGAVLMLILLGSNGSSGVMALWLSRPAKRTEFKRRSQGSVLTGLLEGFNGMVWAGTAFFTLKGMTTSVGDGGRYWLGGAAAMLTLSLLMMGAAYVMRAKDD